MIRINLLPTAKRKRTKSRRPASSSRIVLALVALGVGWVVLGGAFVYKLSLMESETLAARDDAKKNKERAEEIRKLIDEDALQARLRKVEQLRTAIAKLEEERRTPDFVMSELASALTTGKLPDIDAEKQRKIEASDLQAKLNPSWDANSIWMVIMKEEEPGFFVIGGGARDPADLDEFVKRLRSSVRFSEVSNVHFSAVTVPGKKKIQNIPSRLYAFGVGVRISFWD